MCVNPWLVVWYKSSVPDDERYYLQKPFFCEHFRSTDVNLFPLVHWLKVGNIPFSEWNKLDLYLLPCGKCDACRLARSREWTARLMMESRYFERNSFITLTVAPERMDDVFPDGNLRYSPFQDFMKRFRKDISPDRIRFFACGEYGDKFKRPHFHALLFGYDFADRYPWGFHDGIPVYRSSQLEKSWTVDGVPFGFATCGDFCEATVQYVARYVLKKLPSVSDYCDRVPEFIRMSNGIGRSFYNEFSDSIYSFGADGQPANDSVYCGKLKVRTPRYFDKRLEKLHNADFVSLKNYRISNAPDVQSVLKSDLERKEDYIKTVTQGRIKKGDYNV